MIPLEQNYRSTNAILEAANAVIEHNTERKPKRLFSDLGPGDPVQVVEVEDEHSEARFVAAEIARLIGDGWSANELAVFYRANAQSRVLEDVLVRQQIPYQVIGGPRFYERAEIKDAIAYLTALDNPSDAVALMRVANRPRRGIGDTSIRRLVTHADALGISFWEALADPDAAGLAPASARAVRGFRTLLESLLSAAQELRVEELLEAVLERSGTIAAYEAERTIEARGRVREPAGARRRGAGVPPPHGGAVAVRLPAGDLARLRPGRSARRRRARNADDPPQRKGTRVPWRVRDRARRGRLPAHPLDRGERRRGGAAALLRRHDPGDGAADIDARDGATLCGRRSYNLQSRFLDELPASVERERLRPASWSAYGSARQTGARDAAEIPALQTGDSVRHASLGEGVVTQVEPGGVVTVRFADDGSERRLMLDYAPLEKLPR